MKYQKIVHDLKLRILAANDKDAETNQVISEINTLAFDDNHQPIPNSDRIAILQALYAELSRPNFEIFSFDNREYLELIEKAKKLLEENK